MSSPRGRAVRPGGADPGLRWYLHGVPGLVDRLSPGRVVTVGRSMGGNGAILCGHGLGAQRAVAFGALSTLDPGAGRVTEQRRT